MSPSPRSSLPGFALAAAAALASSLALGCPSLADIRVGDGGPGVTHDAPADAGASDATDARTDACTSDPATDPKNCGSCGHRCGPGACKGGVCQPWALTTGLTKPWGLARGGSVLYFTTGVLSVLTCSVDGCLHPSQLATGQPHPRTIAANATNVVWADQGSPIGDAGFFDDSGSIQTCGSAGCTGGTPTVLAPTETQPFDLLVDTDVVYWTDLAGQGIRSCNLAGCKGSPTTIAADPARLSGIAVDPSHVYWAEPDLGNVIRCSRGGCASFTPFATGQTGAAKLDVAGSDVYWSANGAIMTCPITGCGGSPKVFAKDQPSSFAITHDATNLYWTLYAANGRVLSCPLSGCASPTVLGDAEDLPSSVAVDETSVYWADQGSGTIMRVMK